MKRTIRDAFGRWKDALIDQDQQTTPGPARRAHARVTSMEDAETFADDKVAAQPLRDVAMR